MFALWSEPRFLGIVFITHAFVLGLAIIYYFLQRRSAEFRSSWSSTLSWLLLTPIIFLMLGMQWPIPLVFITLIAIYGVKVFFQMTGMYHRSWFVFTAYAGIITCGGLIYFNKFTLFNLMPAIFFFAACLIPMIRNSYKHMVQYMALSLVAFLLLWLFMHLGWIMKMEKGIFITLYLIILTEIFENVYLRTSRRFKSIKLVSKLTPKRSLEGYILGATATLFVAWFLRDLTPHREDWWALGTACFLFGSTGNTIMVVIRRDLGIKVYESFVIGRGDFFTRIERLVFVAPAAYYVLEYLKGNL